MTFDESERYYVAMLGRLPVDFVQRHFIGLPPQLNNGRDEREPMENPAFLVIDARHPQSLNLYRYARDGAFAGDSWHQSIADAWHQAVFEYGDAVGEWVPVPVDIADPIAYGISLLHQ